MSAKPADHPAKKGHVRLGAKEFPVRPGLDDDWDLAEMISEAEEGSTTATIRLAKYVLNDSAPAYAAMKKAATVDGRVSATQMSEFVQQAIGATSPNS